MQLGKKNIEGDLFDERYEILETLSSSAETLIYKAVDVKSLESRPVVLKVFSLKENNREDLIERAKKEALIIYTIQNQHVPTLLDCVQTEEYCYLALDFAVKGDLKFALSTLNRILQQALHTDLNERFLSAEHFKSALEGASNEAKKLSAPDSSKEHLIVVKTFEKNAEEKYKAKSKISKFSLCVASAICALLMITVAKTILKRTTQAEAVIQTGVVEQEMPAKIIPPELSSKEQLIEEISTQAQKIKNIEKQLEQSPTVIYKSQASSITEAQLKQLSLEQLNALKSLREKRILLLSKKLENVLDSDSL